MLTFRDAVYTVKAGDISLDEFVAWMRAHPNEVKEGVVNLLYLHDETRDEPSFLNVLREVYGGGRERIQLFEHSDREKRRYDDWSYDYKTTYYAHFLTEDNTLERKYLSTEYSEDFDGD